MNTVSWSYHTGHGAVGKTNFQLTALFNFFNLVHTYMCIKKKKHNFTNGTEELYGAPSSLVHLPGSVSPTGIHSKEPINSQGLM